MERDVFVSYSSQDIDAAETVVEALEREGLSCWFARRDEAVGTGWAGNIVEAVGSCRVTVLLLSSRSSGSSHVANEAQIAFNRGKPIVQLRMEHVQLSRSLEYPLAGSHWLDASVPPLAQHFDKLASSVRELLENPDPAGLAPMPVQPPKPPLLARLLRWINRGHVIDRYDALSYAEKMILIAGGALILTLLIGGILNTIESFSSYTAPDLSGTWWSGMPGLIGSILAASVATKLTEDIHLPDTILGVSWPNIYFGGGLIAAGVTFIDYMTTPLIDLSILLGLFTSGALASAGIMIYQEHQELPGAIDSLSAAQAADRLARGRAKASAALKPARPDNWPRTIAFAIDCFVMFSALIAVNAVLTAANLDIWVVRALIPVVWILYMWAGTYFGRTVGKQLIGMRTVRYAAGDKLAKTPSEADEAVLDRQAGLLRAVSSFFSITTLGVGYLVALRDPEGRTWHDRIGRSIVVKLD